MQKTSRALTALLTIAVHAGAAAWEYENQVDPMTSKPTRIAWMTSTNSLELDFPYQGENRGHLMVRQHERHGLDVILQVDKGQMPCRPQISPCRVLVRFDDKPPVTFNAVGPEDNDSRAIFLRDAKRFIRAAEGARTIKVQKTFFRNGDQVLEFRTHAPLKWNAGSAPPKSK
jgi:hypothetical protein